MFCQNKIVINLFLMFTVFNKTSNIEPWGIPNKIGLWNTYFKQNMPECILPVAISPKLINA